MWTKNNSIDDLIQGVINHGPDVLEYCECTDDLSQYFNRLDVEHLDYPRPSTNVSTDKWFIPDEYQNINIENFLIELCPEENLDRLKQELSLYKNRNMITVLKCMKYIVDTLKKNNVVWGVGRGSSVASYALYLLGVHRIDSVKYNLPIEEFFK
jgi:DNA polymerase III alpha subunit